MYDPDSYDSYSEFQRNDAKELIPYIVSKMDWKKADKILDFGCGSGYITKNLLLPLVEKSSGNNPFVYGVDISKQMVDFANEKYSTSNVTYVVADVMKDDYEFPCKFDKIFSFHVLHWIKDQEKALNQLYRLLERYGELGIYYASKAAIFSVYEAMSVQPTWAPFLTDVRSFIPKSHFSIDPAKDMRDMMKKIGYEVQESTQTIRKFTFSSLDALVDHGMAANPFIHRIPEDMKDDYKIDYRNCFIPFVKPASNTENPSAVEVDSHLLVIRARKM